MYKQNPRFPITRLKLAVELIRGKERRDLLVHRFGNVYVIWRLHLDDEEVPGIEKDTENNSRNRYDEEHERKVGLGFGLGKVSELFIIMQVSCKQ